MTGQNYGYSPGHVSTIVFYQRGLENEGGKLRRGACVISGLLASDYRDNSPIAISAGPKTIYLPTHIISVSEKFQKAQGLASGPECLHTGTG
jgi:hypothetical protein